MQPAKILLKSLVKIRRQFKSLLPLPLAVLLTLSQASASPTKAQDSPRRNESFPKIGLALGGGGTRGCAHIGVLRVLERERIPISCIAGTSMGAIVGGLYASGVSLDSIEDMLYSKKLLRAYDTVPIPVRIAVIPFFFIAHVIGHHPYDGLYRGNKFANFITNSVPDNRRNIENSAIPFRAIAANLLDGKTYVLSSGNIGRAIQSSSALPFLRRPVDWQGKLLVDGGVVTNLPCEQARELGADYVIAVNVDTDLITVEKKHFHKVGSVTSRAINMHLSAIDSWQMKKADLVIHPNVCNITLLSRRLDDVTVAIRAGEVATENALPALREILKKKNTGNMQLTTEGSKNTNSNNE